MSNVPENIKKIDDYTWEIPTSFKDGMNVPARIIASQNLMKGMDKGVFDQVTNVVCLPGIQKYAYCMPDGHWGYGFPIGGVAAFDINEGIISPGGIGFDINCGMRLIRTNLLWSDVQPKLKELIDTFFKIVPAGVGCKGFVNVNKSQFNDVMTDGVKWCVDNGYGWKEDIERCEGYGKIEWADPKQVSDKAIKRGINQLGTLGSGNHYLEVQVAHKENIYDFETAKAFGIEPEQVVVMVHCGSRGFGHQIATDHLKSFNEAMKKYGIVVRDRELSCAPFNSNEGQSYYKEKACAANMAFANRQVILHRIREGFEKVFNAKAEDLGLNLVYDVAHNVAKVEKHNVNGKLKDVVVHRKGSTRAFGPGNPELPVSYRKYGQPVILGGSMETGSYLLAGTQVAMDKTFGSTAHGSGRTKSRMQAKKENRGEELQKKMLKEGIYVKAVSMSGLAEEAGSAYKDIDEVVETLDNSGITKPIIKLIPKGNVKG